MNYDNLFDQEAEHEFIYALMETLQAGCAEGHQALAMVPKEAFGFPVTRSWFQAVKEMVAQGQPPEYILVVAKLRSNGTIKTPEELATYSAVFETIHYAGNPLAIGKHLLELYQRRESVRIFATASEKTGSLLENFQEIAFGVSKEVMDLISGDEVEASPCGDEISAMIKKKARFAVDQHSAKLAWFGISDLDEEVPASSGNLIIISARPGRGKTALAIQTLAETSSERTEWVYDEHGQHHETVSGNKCLFVSLELPKEEVYARIASWFTMHSSGSFWKGSYGRQEEVTLADSRDRMNNILVWAAPSRTPWSRIESKIRGAYLRHQVKVVVIDYFGLVGRPDPGKGTGPFYEAAKLSGQIRSLAQTLGICIVLLCQINREGAEGEPGMEDLRETGSLEQDAQTIFALYGGKPKNGEVSAAPWEKPEEVVPKDDATWIKVLKNRNGKAGFKFQVHFDGSINHFAKAEAHT